MSNADVARVLVDLADLLEIQGANPFRVRAHRGGARTVETLAEPIALLVEDPERSPDELPGIGKDLAEKIRRSSRPDGWTRSTNSASRCPPRGWPCCGFPAWGPRRSGVFQGSRDRVP
ncbi:MAG: hypothetical protein CM1200mP2_31170 [Planctomycetaceae bacterium]|nr:MAG: hypothetical protein CM1200mP2_31170 [Planctomycetaceae bacterium]